MQLSVKAKGNNIYFHISFIKKFWVINKIFFVIYMAIPIRGIVNEAFKL